MQGRVVPRSTSAAAPEINASTLRKLAVDADCDPRTILAAIEGKPGRGPARERAVKVLTRAGYIEASK